MKKPTTILLAIGVAVFSLFPMACDEDDGNGNGSGDTDTDADSDTDTDTDTDMDWDGGLGSLDCSDTADVCLGDICLSKEGVDCQDPVNEEICKCLSFYGECLQPICTLPNPYDKAIENCTEQFEMCTSK